VQFEERALLREFGARYQSYREQVPLLLPWPRLRLRQSKEGT
jgi:protein-S-isoprenylcysteine O-methyltransferase Ste14